LMLARRRSRSLLADIGITRRSRLS
jgi:hypothetical protein